MKLDNFLIITVFLFGSFACKEANTGNTENTAVVTDSTTANISTNQASKSIDIKSFFEQQTKKTFATATIKENDNFHLTFEQNDATSKTQGDITQWKSEKGDVFVLFSYSVSKGKTDLSIKNLRFYDSQGNDLTTNALDWAKIDAEFKKALVEVPKRGFVDTQDFMVDMPMINFDRKVLSLQLTNGKEIAKGENPSSVIFIEFEWLASEGKFVEAAPLPEGIN